MKIRILLFFALLASFQTISFAQSSLRDMLGLFVAVPENDSIASITENDSALVVSFTNTETGESRVEEIPVNALQRQKIMAVYQERSRTPREIKAEAPPAVQTSEDKDISAQRRNHIGYVTGQTTLSYYVYSLVWPIGFEMDGKTASALSLFSVPGFFTAHYLFQKRYPLHDAHIAGINYMTLWFLGLTYSVPFALASDEGMWDAFRVAAISSMLTYPAGIYCGYRLGVKNENNAGRVDMQSALAYAGYFLGFTSPMMYLGESMDVQFVRTLSFISATALSVAGHFCGNKYRENGIIPRGNPAGISSYGILGLALGITMDAWIQPENITVLAGIPWVSYLGGLAIGMNVFKSRYDLLERGTYNLLGMLGGIAAASGILIIGEPEDAGLIASILTAGAFSGYGLTNYLTRDLVEKSGANSAKASFQLQLGLSPQATVKRLPHGQRYVEYSLSPLAVKF
ncbi:MAG: hypothetical protein JXA71_01200 [Chitinispirillaceae bacterium]|nr:hypothetical protein [Chitinispirillaceae bacterium]